MQKCLFDTNMLVCSRYHNLCGSADAKPKMVSALDDSLLLLLARGVVAQGRGRKPLRAKSSDFGAQA